MRVLFDGYWWDEGPYSNRQVLREFVFAWEREFPHDEMVIAVRARAMESARRELPERVELVASRIAPQGISAIFELPILRRRTKADIVLAHNFTPLGRKSAVFVHDLLFLTNPEWFTRRERLYFALMPLMLPHASRILTSSVAEAHRISQLVRNRQAVTAVGLGLSPGLTSAVPARPQGIDDIDGFVLAVGRLNARKNLAVSLLAAVESGEISRRVPMLVVGEASGKGADLPESVHAAVADGSVRFLGFVTNSELSWLYANTALFVFLSLDEGFGMPMLEAVHFGAPILASDIPVFREILGNRAFYVPPRNLSRASAAIALALQEPEAMNTLGTATREYSWERSVHDMRHAIAGIPGHAVRA